MLQVYSNLNHLQRVIFKEQVEHGIRVGNLAYVVAKNYLSEKNSLNILIAGKYHDIGKCFIPISIINKPDILTEQEYKIMKKHALYSYELLKKNNINENIYNLVKHHHENMDGTGYPDQLLGECIPVGARILRICDFYDALTHDRPYRDRLTSNEAIKLMLKHYRQIDLKIFKVFLKYT